MMSRELMADLYVNNLGSLEKNALSILEHVVSDRERIHEREQAIRFLGAQQLDVVIGRPGGDGSGNDFRRLVRFFVSRDVCVCVHTGGLQLQTLSSRDLIFNRILDINILGARASRNTIDSPGGSAWSASFLREYVWIKTQT